MACSWSHVNATPPSVGVTIGGETFYHDPEDLIHHDTQGLSAGQCLTSIQSGGSPNNSSQAVYLLGETFLNNVLSVFDVENGRLCEIWQTVSGMSTRGRLSEPKNYAGRASTHVNLGMILTSSADHVAQCP